MHRFYQIYKLSSALSFRLKSSNRANLSCQSSLKISSPLFPFPSPFLRSEMETNPTDESRFLDLTSCQLHDLADIDLPLEEIDFIANRLTKLDERISLLSHLKKLSLRQNMLDDQVVELLTHWNAISGLEFYGDATARAISKPAAPTRRIQ